MKKHRILYINDWGGWGGAEKVTLNLVRFLNREQYEPYFVLGSDGLFAQALRAEGIVVYVVPMTPMSVPDSKKYLVYILLPLFFFRLIIYTIKIYFVARSIHPDLIQTCSIQAKLVGSFVAKLLRVKLLWHIQNIQPRGYRRRLVQSLAKRFPDMIVATSQDVADVYRDAIPDDKLKINHAGVELADFDDVDSALARETLQAELGLTDEKIVANVSMVRYWKGSHVFVRAAAEVLKVLPKTVFLIVGESQFGKDREYKEYLTELVTHKLNLKDKIKFLGFRNDVYSMIAAADCLVHCPIKSDPLPTIVLEAMALQTPVVGTAIGGIPEEIDDQVTGLLVEPNDEIGLSKAIIQILENSDQAQRFAGAGRQKLEAEFSRKLFVDKFEKIYTQVLA
jgi:L-malate glycosyltransferase